MVAAIEAAVPEGAGLIRITGDPLPFPDLIDASGAEALGPLPVTPIESAVAQTFALLRGLRRTVGWTRSSTVSRPPEPAPGNLGYSK